MSYAADVNIFFDGTNIRQVFQDFCLTEKLLGPNDVYVNQLEQQAQLDSVNVFYPREDEYEFTLTIAAVAYSYQQAALARQLILNHL